MSKILRVLKIPVAVWLAGTLAEGLVQFVDSFIVRCEDCGARNDVKPYFGGERILCETCLQARFDRAYTLMQRDPTVISMRAQMQSTALMVFGVIALLLFAMGSCFSEVIGLYAFIPLGLFLVMVIAAIAYNYYIRTIKPDPKRWAKTTIRWVALKTVWVLLIAIFIATPVIFIAATPMMRSFWTQVVYWILAPATTPMPPTP